MLHAEPAQSFTTVGTPRCGDDSDALAPCEDRDGHTDRRGPAPNENRVFRPAYASRSTRPDTISHTDQAM